MLSVLHFSVLKTLCVNSMFSGPESVALSTLRQCALREICEQAFIRTLETAESPYLYGL